MQRKKHGNVGQVTIQTKGKRPTKPSQRNTSLEINLYHLNHRGEIFDISYCYNSKGHLISQTKNKFSPHTKKWNCEENFLKKELSEIGLKEILNQTPNFYGTADYIKSHQP